MYIFGKCIFLFDTCCQQFGEYVSVEYTIYNILYMLVLDISCQQLGDECKLKGFCAPFGRRVGEYTFLNIYVGIEYIMPTMGG